MNELDAAERRAMEMIQFYQDECRKQCAPYVKILMDIRALRPQVFYIDGKMMVPFLPGSTQTVGCSEKP